CRPRRAAAAGRRPLPRPPAGAADPAPGRRPAQHGAEHRLQRRHLPDPQPLRGPGGRLPPRPPPRPPPPPPAPRPHLPTPPPRPARRRPPLPRGPPRRRPGPRAPLPRAPGRPPPFHLRLPPPPGHLAGAGPPLPAGLLLPLQPGRPVRRFPPRRVAVRPRRP